MDKLKDMEQELLVLQENVMYLKINKLFQNFPNANYEKFDPFIHADRPYPIQTV